MSSWGWILILLCILGAGLVILRERYRTGKTMDTIEEMLDQTMSGTFSEERFDESRLSALETKFVHYLSASAVSARNISVEKDRIKTLISDISHQTKTPVANLLLYCELLQEEELSDDAREHVEALYAQAEKLRFLIDALVKLSRLENGILTLTPREQELQPVLEKAAGQYVSDAEKKGLYLELRNTSIRAKLDAKWTAEALCNLIDNAVKYTDHGGIVISASKYEMFVRIDISDSGIGISEEEYAGIFRRFYRSENVREKEGVGIGLYLAREILSAEGGYIKVKSTTGEGTTFSVFLPA